MIIFGTKAKYRAVGSGQFFCPHCQKTRQYEHKRAKTYFAVYFIPIFPISDGGEFVECQTCRMTYNTEVLNFKTSPPQPDVARMLNTVKMRLEKAQPVEYIVSDLTQEGLDRDIANNVINMAIGQNRAVCPQCELTYASSITTCPNCRVALQKTPS
jgi:hypothetical protein